MIKGYHYDVIRNDRNKDRGYVMIIIKNTSVTLSGIVLEEVKGERESIWMTIL